MITSHTQDKLHLLLKQLFDRSELRRLATQFTDKSDTLADYLPGDSESFKNILESFIAWLLRRGMLLPDLMPALRRQRPLREREICEVENLIVLDQTQWALGDHWSLREGLRLRSGEYQLQRAIGGGSYGDVWAAKRVKDDADVAIKFLRWTGSRLDEKSREQFFRGPELIGSIDHPHIVRILEKRCEEGGLDYYVMECLDGEVFESAAKRLSDDACLTTLHQLADALEAIHKHGLVYRDVSPRNVFVARTGSTKLIDCDLVCPQRSHGSTRLAESIYLAPEIRDGGTETPAADVYSLAVTGVFAFHRKNIPLACAYDLVMKSFIHEQLTCGMPIRHVLERACCQDPKQRPSISQFRLLLQNATKRSRALDRIQSLTQEAMNCNDKAEIPPKFKPRGGRTTPEETVGAATECLRHEAWSWLRSVQNRDISEEPEPEDGWLRINYLLSAAPDPWRSRFRNQIDIIRTAGGTAQEVLQAFVEAPPLYEP